MQIKDVFLSGETTDFIPLISSNSRDLYSLSITSCVVKLIDIEVNSFGKVSISKKQTNISPDVE
jgi:hypothetical protein